MLQLSLSSPYLQGRACPLLPGMRHVTHLATKEIYAYGHMDVRPCRRTLGAQVAAHYTGQCTSLTVPVPIPASLYRPVHLRLAINYMSFPIITGVHNSILPYVHMSILLPHSSCVPTHPRSIHIVQIQHPLCTVPCLAHVPHRAYRVYRTVPSPCTAPYIPCTSHIYILTSCVYIRHACSTEHLGTQPA